MNKFGLTAEEKRTHLQKYNHALFKNSLSFMDLVWEINVKFKTIVILEDKGNTGRNLEELPYDVFYEDCIENRLLESDIDTFRDNMSYDKLKDLKEEAAFYIHLRAADDEWHLHRVVLTPATDEAGKTYCVYCGALNLHEEEQREMASFRNQEQFKEALLSGCYFWFEFDVTAGGMITEEFMARDGSYPIKDSTGKSAPIHYHEWVDKWYELYEPEFDNQEVNNIFSVDYFKETFDRHERLLSVEVKQKSQKTGEIEFMHIFVILLENPKDKHINACIIWRDITPFRRELLEERRELEEKNEELKRTVSREEQFRQASLSGAIMVYNINLTRNLIEDEFYEIIDGENYPILELIGLKPPCNFDEFCKKWSEAKIMDDSRETFLNMFNREYLLNAYERDERLLEIEFETTIGRGIPVILRNTALLVKDDETGDIIAMINAKDVTKQREDELKKQEALKEAYEAASHANAAKSEFLFRMSHDIRTPMNAIIGMTAIAAANLDDRAHVLDSLQKISISSKHLLGLINEVLDMSKIESGKLELQESPFNINELVDSLVEIVQPQIDLRKHELIISKNDIMHEEAIGDTQLMQQALVNLLSNAYKYTPDGGKIKFTITEKPVSQSAIVCYDFIIEDNGIGMSDEFKEHLFEPFERSDDERVTKEQGTGLGMAITSSIIQMMNGEIDVESTLDVGTKFTVTFYLKLPEEHITDSYFPDLVKTNVDSLLLKDTMQNYQKQDFSSKRVLLAEDNEINSEIAIEILKMTGLKIDHVWNGKEAYEVMEQSEDGFYDLIFMDIQMPEMNGYDATRAIRASGREYLHNIPIIAMSANAFAEDVKASIEAGMNEHVSKPLDFDYLLDVLNRWLER